MTGGAASVTAKFPGMIVNGVEYKEKNPYLHIVANA